MATETTDNIEITIFLKNGDTFRFENVLIIRTIQSINFYYTSMGDGRRKEATFFKDQIAGFSQG